MLDFPVRGRTIVKTSTAAQAVAKILPFLPPYTTFDAEAVGKLSTAYELALAALHDAGQPESVREIIARRIIELAKKGELDSRRLANTVINSLGLRP